MTAFSAESFAAALAIIGLVIIVSALLSGLIERSGLPQVAVFLALGAALGPAGLGVLELALNIAEVRRRAGLALRLLGPGTLLNAAFMALAGWWLLGLGGTAATILGA